MHTTQRVVQASRGRRVPRQQVTAARTNRRVGSRWRAAAVAMSLGCAAASVQAESFFQIEAGIGASNYTAGPDGEWYQKGMSHSLHLTAPAWRAGVQMNLSEPSGYVPGVSLHALYLNLGHEGMTSDAAPDQDGVYHDSGYYNPQAHSCVGPCGDQRLFVSGGRMQVVALTVEPYWNVKGFRLGIEAGPALFHVRWSSTATVITPDSPRGPVGSVETFTANPHWELGAMIGASIGRGPVTLRYDYVFAKSHNLSGTSSSGDTYVPAGWRGAHMLTLGVVF